MNNFPKNIFKVFLVIILSLYAVFLSAHTVVDSQESAGEFVDSTVLTTKVKALLLADEYVKALPITVKTYKNIVQLSGFVDNRGQEDRAVEIATNVPGVLAVHDALIIK